MSTKLAMLLTPVAFVDYAELSLGDVNEVDVHVLGAEEEHVLVLAQLHGGDVLPSEGTQVVLLDEHAVVAPPDAQVPVLRARDYAIGL